MTALRGHYDDIHIITEKTATEISKIASRGNGAATKYLLIPKNIRCDISENNKVFCNKIETDDKLIYVYTIDKNKQAKID